jgi:hypothetical protein
VPRFFTDDDLILIEDRGTDRVLHARRLAAARTEIFQGPDAAGLRSLYERVLSELTPSPPVMRIG